MIGDGMFPWLVLQIRLENNNNACQILLLIELILNNQGLTGKLVMLLCPRVIGPRSMWLVVRTLFAC